MKYYITVLPGIQEIAAEEIRAKCPGVILDAAIEGRGNFLVPFETREDATILFDIKTAEDLFVYLGEIKLRETSYDLERLSGFIETLMTFDPGLAVHRKITTVKKKKTTFRVVAQAIHDPKGYRRVDFQEALEKAICNRYNQKWDIVEDEAQLEIWVHLLGRRAILGLRLSDKTMRHREYKVEHLPASLRPTIAYALVWLSKIEDEDVFLDPMCGAGTILIERAQAGPYKQLLGGDLWPEAVEAARQNIGNKYKPIKVQQWDAARLPLPDLSVDKVACNLPFGKQISSPKENIALYQKFFQEVERVLKFHGKAVFLTSENQLMKDVLSHHPKLKLTRHFTNISVLGVRATIFVYEKISSH